MTLPHPATFARSSAISYFVVFTTTPRSVAMAREIAADATISVSLLRDVRVDAMVPRYGSLASSPFSASGRSPTTAASTPTTSGDESDMPPVASRRLLRRVVRGPGQAIARSTSLTRLNTRGSAGSKSRPNSPKDQLMHDREKPLPQLPAPSVIESRVLYTDVSVGFPKRPRYRCEPHQRHPSLEVHKALPDGLYKGRIQLEKHMIPSFDWVGLRVKVRFPPPFRSAARCAHGSVFCCSII